MASVLIVIYLLIVLALIVVILLQRSEGGGLGMGGGGGGGLVSARGSANLLTRTTAILGTLFMVTAIGLTIVSQLDDTSSSVLDRAVGGEGAPTTVLDALDSLGTGSDADLALPEDLPEPAAGQDPVLEDDPSLALPAGEVEPSEPTAPAPASNNADLALPSEPVEGDTVDQTPAEETSIEQSPIEGSPAQEGGVDLALPETGEDAPPAQTN